jgi:enoyl-CoA hydratase
VNLRELPGAYPAPRHWQARYRTRDNVRPVTGPVLYELAEGVATIALDRPDTRNALSDEVLDELIAAFEAARDDAEVRCVILTSTHEKVFSSGGDLAGFAAEAPLVHKHFGTDRFPRLFRLIGELGKPTICAANGHVLAGALGLALACDLIVARDGVRFGTPEINAFVRDWAGRLAAKSPVLVRLGKDALFRSQDMALADALEFLHAQLTIAFSTDDIQEGVKAFFEKREPEWTGR